MTGLGLPANIQKQLQKHRHFLLYTLIGLSGVAIDYVLFALGARVFGVGILLANFVAISVAIVNNFWLNTKYNFKTSDHLLKRFVLFYLVGALGIVLSEILITLFHYGFGANDLIAKLGTLPFVLVFQFLLNRRFSFGNIKQTEAQLKRFFFHWPLFVIIAFYTAFSLVMIGTIPSDFGKGDPRNAPDETIHYRFNVEYILKNKQLPVSGRDDLSAYKACRDNEQGLIPCVYSYNIYPGPNYVASAISAGTLGRSGSVTPEVAARLTSLVSGILFVIFTYFAAHTLVRRRLVAAVLVAAAAFIPQVLFTNSYTNLDAHSLAVAAFTCFTAVKLLSLPRSPFWQIAFCVSIFGLLPISKYNYAFIFLAGVGLLVYLFIKHRFGRQEMLRFALYAAASFLLLASFWYIRNLVLYGDPIGQSFVINKMSEYHELGFARPLASPSSFVYLVQEDFFNTLFRSFFVAFGGMTYFLPEHAYALIILLLLICVAWGGYVLYQRLLEQKAVRNILLAILAYSTVALGTLALVTYNSLHYDYQPQGRYMFPILVPSVLLLAFMIKQDKRFLPLAFLLLAGTAYIFIEGSTIYIQEYLGAK